MRELHGNDDNDSHSSSQLASNQHRRRLSPGRTLHAKARNPQEPRLAATETARVGWGRIVVLGSIILAACLVSSGAYSTLRDGEVEDFVTSVSLSFSSSVFVSHGS
jgi:hypothetical protein